MKARSSLQSNKQTVKPVNTSMVLHKSAKLMLYTESGANIIVSTTSFTDFRHVLRSDALLCVCNVRNISLQDTNT